MKTKDLKTPAHGRRSPHNSLGLMFLNVAGRAARQNVLGVALGMSERPPNFVAWVWSNGCAVPLLCHISHPWR